MSKFEGLFMKSIEYKQIREDFSNFNLENQLCEGFLRAKSSKNLVELYMYMVALGRFALSLKKCDEYLFVCVKHLLEIFDTDESNDWSLLACSVNFNICILIHKVFRGKCFLQKLLHFLKILMKKLLEEFNQFSLLMKFF